MNERDPGRQAEFLEVVEKELEKATGSRSSWRVDPAMDAIGTWIYVDKDRALIPDKGWKLHISATPWSASKVLDRTLPILFSEDACFKFAASIDVLAAINEGEGGLSQVGKFMTIYPNSDAQAVQLAARIHEATKGLWGPEILTDEPLVSGSLVHYRFGEFVGELDALPEEGERFPTDGVIPTPPLKDEGPERDDPFRHAGIAIPVQKKLIGERYLITGTLYRSPRGSVHLAADLIEPGTRILKRAARWGRALPDGTDARDLLRMEAQLLERLAGDSRFPASYGLIEQGDLYLVLEFVDGPTLARLVRKRSELGPLSRSEIVRLGRGISEALEHMHSKGLVYRDLNPENVIVVANGEPRLLDLELASVAGSSSALFAAGSPGYASPQQLEGSPAAVADDVYALGALLSFAATGHEPSEGLRLDGVDEGLAAIIERCCAADPSERWPSMTEVNRGLSGINTATA